MNRGVKPGTNRGKYTIEPTRKQALAIKQFLVEGKNWTQALRIAGYSESTAKHYSKKEFLKSCGAQKFYCYMDNKAMKEFGMPLPEKIMELYLEGTQATKTGADGIEHPDWNVRYEYLLQFAYWFGWTPKASK